MENTSIGEIPIGVLIAASVVAVYWLASVRSRESGRPLWIEIVKLIGWIAAMPILTVVILAMGAVFCGFAGI